MGRVIVLGSINVDVESRIDSYPRPGEKVTASSLERFAGGKGANQAVAARALGGEVVMVGAVGDDDAGRESLNRLYRLGIKLEVERIPRTPTGTAVVLSDGMTNAIAVFPGANHQVSARPLAPLRGLGSADLLLTQLETPVETVAAAARYAAERGVRVVINLAPAVDLPADVFELADPLIVPEETLPLVTASGASPRSLIVLRGKDGLDWDGEHHAAAVLPDTEVADTVGATDALVGTLAAALVRGDSRAEAARLALNAATENVRHHGAHRDAAF
ncbi:MAG: PfkB family carbohydrate kinase [Propioniciclava sp.]